MSDNAAWIIGICILLSSCGDTSLVKVTVGGQKKITREYCAGMKAGEAIRESLTITEKPANDESEG